MSSLTASAGSAIRWKTFQLVAVNVIFFVRILVLARLLVPNDFGLVALATVPIGFLLSITNLGMIPALIQAKEPSVRHYNVAWTVGLVRAVSTSVVVVLAAPWLAALAGAPDAVPIMRTLAVRPAFAAAASIGVARLTKTLDFRSLAWIALIESIANATISIGLATWIGVWALVAGNLGGACAQAIASYIFAPHRPRLVFDRAAAATLVRFGRWIFVSGVVAMIGNALLRFIISRRLGVAELGLYLLASNLTFQVADAFANISGSVSFPIYAKLQTELERATRFFQATLTVLSSVLVPSFALLFALAPSLVENVLGPGWNGTVPVIRILSVVCILGVFGHVTGPPLEGFGRPYLNASLGIVQTTVLLTLVWGMTGPYGIAGVALAWLPATGLSELLGLAFAVRILNRPLAGLAKPISATAVAAIAGAITAWSVDAWLSGTGGLLLGGTTGLCVAGGLLWLADHHLGTGLRRAVVQVVPQVASIPWLTDEQTKQDA